MPVAAILALLLAGCASSPAPHAPGPIRVMVYNIHAGKDAAGIHNLERVAELLGSGDIDLVLLQEVDRGTLRSGGEDQPRVLEERTGLDAVFGRTLDYQGGEYGIAVLSRLPVVGQRMRELVVEPRQERAGGSYEPRGVLLTTLRSGAGPLHVLNTHLDASRDDRYRLQEVEQLLHVADSLRTLGGRVMIGGDLNAEPNSAVIARLLDAGWRDAWTVCGSGDGLTFPADAPVKRIDYLFLSEGLQCRDAWVQRTTVSDHLPLVIVLEQLPSQQP